MRSGDFSVECPSRFIEILQGPYTGADLGGGCRGCAPPHPWDDLQFSNTTGILRKKKKTMWFTGVEVEQETSVPPPKKNPGSPPCYNSTAETSLMTSLKNQFQVILNLFISTHSVFLSWVIRLELKKEDHLWTQIKRVKFTTFLFTLGNLKIGHFISHRCSFQGRQGNLQKSLMHMPSCFFAH